LVKFDKVSDSALRNSFFWALPLGVSDKTTWDRCYDFKNIFAKKLAKLLAFLAQTTAIVCKTLIIALVFDKNARPIFSLKVVENRRKL
jgi:hypothetical protein